MTHIELLIYIVPCGIMAGIAGVVAQEFGLIPGVTMAMAIGVIGWVIYMRRMK